MDFNNEEQLKILEREMSRHLQSRIDAALFKIQSQTMTRSQALDLVLEVRNYALELFPDKADVFDLVIGPRFKKTIDKYTIG